MEIKQDYTFYPVYESTSQVVCFMNKESTIVLTFEELISEKYLKLEDGKLWFNFSGQGVRTEGGTMYLPDDKGINEIASTNGYCHFSKISFPNTLKVISPAATFKGTNSGFLKEIDFSRCTQGVSLPKHAFYDTGVETIKGFNNITKVGQEAFYRCDLLSNIDGDLSSLVEIGANAFQRTSIQNIVINSNATVGNGAFYDCSKLKTAVFKEGFKTINNELFSGCTNLESVTFPKSATFFSSDYSGFTSVFASCYKLKNVTVHKDNKDLMSYGSAIVKKTNGAGNTLLFANEFSTVIPNGVNKIPQGSIIKNNMKEITLPSGLWDLSNFAFEYCYSLETIIFKDTKAEFDKLMGSRAFQFYNSTCYGYSNPLTIKATDQTFKSNF